MDPQYTLIKDIPATADDFQSHEKIATSLYKMVQTSPGGKTIGLEGKWGSGKSTIIRLLQRKIDAERKHRFFSFDSWTHQDDPLRRSFLEELIGEAVRAPWFVGPKAKELVEKWTKKKGELSRKIKETEKSVDPVITPFGKAMFVALMLCPVGVSVLIALLNKFTTQISFSGWPTFPEAGLVIAFACALGPLIVFAVNAVLNRKDADRAKVWSVFFNKGYVEEKIIINESLDRSTIEFQPIFRELMLDALGDNEQRLVIVLDNLDRLTIDEAQAVWPMLRSLIDFPEFPRPPWFKRLWVIVPHDREALEAQVQEPDTATIDDKETQNKHIESASSHFLDKVFQLKVFVPAPMLSNWRVYLDKNLKKAFGAEAEGSAHVIYLLLTRWYSFSTPPGPREIITIINGMVATKTLWEDDAAGASIRLEHHAYFSILKRERSIADLRTQLLNKKINLQEDLLGAGVEDSLFALETNIAPEDAKQILYRPVIEEMLMAEDAHTQLMAKYSQPGFAAIFDMSIGEILATHAAADQLLYVQIAQRIMGGQFFTDRSEIQKIGLLRAMDSSLKRLNPLPFNQAAFVTLLDTLIQCDGTRSVLKQTIKQLFDNASDYFAINKFDVATMQNAHTIWCNNALSTYLHGQIRKFTVAKSSNDFIERYIQLEIANEIHILQAFDIEDMPDRIASDLSNRSAMQMRWRHILAALQFVEKNGKEIPGAVFDNLSSRILTKPKSSRPEDMTGVLPYLLEKSKSNQHASHALEKLYGSLSLHSYLQSYHPSAKEDDNLDYTESLQWHAANKKHICGRLFYLISKEYPIKLNEQVYGYLFYGPKPDMEILEGLREVLPELPDPEGYLRYLEGNNMPALATYLKGGTLAPDVPLMCSGRDLI